MKAVLLTLFFTLSFLSTTFSQAAETVVTGRVVDENQDPIAFASVVLFNSDSTMAKAGYSDDNGSFHFSPITPGNYYINISFVGYDTYSSPAFSVTENNSATLDV